MLVWFHFDSWVRQPPYSDAVEFYRSFIFIFDNKNTRYTANGSQEQ